MPWPWNKKTPAPVVIQDSQVNQPQGRAFWQGGFMDSILSMFNGLFSGHGNKNSLSRSEPVLTHFDIDQAIAWDGIMDTFHTRPGEDALANGVEFPKLGEEEEEFLNNFLGELDFWPKYEEAYTAMRRSGFAAIWMDTGALDNSQPMGKNEISRLRELIVYDAEALEADPTGYTSQYSTPERWQIVSDPNRAGKKIHKSRLLVFPGRSSSPRRRWTNGGKGDPEAKKLWQAWQAWRDANMTIPQIAKTFEENTVYLEGLNKAMGSPVGRENIQAKLLDHAATRSALHINALDVNERFERLGPPLTGLPDMLDRAERFMVAESGGFPYVVLLGKLPGGGLGGAGESDGAQDEWHQFLGRQRRKYLTHPLCQWFRLIQPVLKTRSNMPFKSMKFDWPAFEQLSDTEWEDLQLKRSQRHKINSEGDNPPVTRDEVRKQLAKEGAYDLELNEVPALDPVETDEDPETPEEESYSEVE